MTALRTFRYGVLLASVLLGLQAQAQDDVRITSEKLSDTVHVLFGEGGNIGVSAGADGVFLVDDKWSEYGDAISQAVAAISERPIDYVINTHWHFDHADGNAFFSNAGSVVIAHDKTRQRLKSGGFIETHDLHVDPMPPESLPVITFSEALTLHLNGEDVQVLHVRPAHTDGDAIVWFKGSNIVHAGDVVLNGVYPLIDYSSGGTVEGSIAAIDQLLEVIDDRTRIIPGHGPVSEKADVEAFREVLVTLAGRVAAMKSRGMTLEQVIASAPTADFDGRWNTWGDDWKAISLSSIYGALP